jgi:lysophospholipid acyltransferase (LPLAT)-like uncharacterized protein
MEHSEAVQRPLFPYKGSGEATVIGQRERPSSSEAGGGYRVDTVPRFVHPVYLVTAWALALILYAYYLCCRATSKISIEGPGDHDLSQHAIFCMWHESWWSYFVVFLRYPTTHAMITHPAAYMKPVHNVFRLMGVKDLLLGSSGEEGRRAVNALAELIKRGWSTTISPDGPYGPARVLKKGVLHLALKSGAPIVPLTICSSRFIQWPSWDSKRFPLPFNRIRVTIHEPITVHENNFEEVSMQITTNLGGPL